MASKPRTSYDVRKINLDLLIKQWGGPTSLAKKLGHSGPSYLSQLMNERLITEKTARAIEGKLDLPAGWLDIDRTAQVVPALDQTQVIKAVQAVGAALEEEGIAVKPGKFADLVTLVYEEAVKKGGIDEQFVNRIVRLIK